MRFSGRLQSGVRYLAVVAFAVPLAVLADAVERHELRVAIDDGTPHGQVFVNLGGGESGIDIGDMQVGETRSIVDDSGKTVLVTRTEKGYDLNVDGKDIELPNVMDMAAAHDGEIEFAEEFLMHDGAAMGHEVFVMKGVPSDGPAPVTIISEKAIDSATRDAIRSLLVSAGHSDQVEFIDALPMEHAAVAGDGEKHVTVIRRQQVNATN